MKVLDLFSGIGGFSIGLERAGFETVAFCEIEDYPRAVLRRHWPDVPIYRDIKQLTGEQLRADGIVPDVICGGYPCQPFSVAGRQRGQEDERHLWPEMYRLIRECRPRWVICENVSGHIKLGLDEVLASLETEGYTVWTFIIPACAVNAPHKRDRLWIVAHANSSSDRRTSRQDEKTDGEIPQRDNGGVVDQSGKVFTSVAYANSDDRGSRRRAQPQERETRVEHGRGGKRQPVGKPDENVADTQCEGRKRSRAARKMGGAKKKESRARHQSDVFSQASNSTVAYAESEQGASDNNGQEPRTVGKSEQGQFGRSDSGSYEGQWSVEPNVGRVANGVPARSHRIKGLGNAVVPQIPEIIGQTILAFEEERGS